MAGRRGTAARAKKGAALDEVERMHAAWVKAVLLQTILWSHPYVKDGEF
ncbi:MAG: hypothetical protein JSS31_03305 [Proteobacteria bacterium]|nr:hypothetical protein [Pseudomonadota bacterium]MBS0492976.1 hypothetical protein [Pseudomonadota bacterium]